MLFDSDSVNIADDGITLQWIKDKPEYKSKFYQEYKLIESENLVVFDFNGSGNKKVFIWEMTKALFESFMSVTILTYQFDGSHLRAFFDYKEIEYIVDTKKLDRGVKLGHLIKVYDNKDLNSIGNHLQGLGSRHLKSQKGRVTCSKLSDNIYNFVRHKVPTRSSDIMWTTFKDVKKHVSGNGYAKGFIPLNQKATNKYAHKTTLIYGLNRYMRTPLKRYFESRGVEVNEDLWSLNEMLQWIFRSAIRNDEPIHIYVPSRRMRQLLLDWIETH